MSGINYDWEWGELEDYARELEDELASARAEIVRVTGVLSEHYAFIWKIKHEIRDFLIRDGVQTRRPIKDNGFRVPELEMKVLDLRDPEAERQFLASLRENGVPVESVPPRSSDTV